MSQGKGNLALALFLGLVATVALLSLLSSLSAQAIAAATGSAAPVDIAEAAALTCSETTTLEELVTCIDKQMPGKGSGEFDVPSDINQRDWRNVVGQMLEGNCEDDLLASLSSVYSISNRTYEGKDYCVLLEVLDEDSDGKVDRGWGTFIVNNMHSSCRELSIQIAHPKYDLDTDMQGIGVFKGTGSRSFLMAGTHRHANYVCGNCQPITCDPGDPINDPVTEYYVESDVAHNVENLFQPAVEAILEFYEGNEESFVAMQFHGMGDDSCPGVDVFLTHGQCIPPVAGDKILALKRNLKNRNPTWTVTVPGDVPVCYLCGERNVQGRLLNTVSATSVCTTEASSYSGRFIHIEQKYEEDGMFFRDANNWIDAVNDTWSCIYLPIIFKEY